MTRGWVADPWSFLPLLFTLSGIALLLADAGKAEQATEVYASAARHPFVANSRWFRDIAGAELAAVSLNFRC